MMNVDEIVLAILAGIWLVAVCAWGIARYKLRVMRQAMRDDPELMEAVCEAKRFVKAVKESV